MRPPDRFGQQPPKRDQFGGQKDVYSQLQNQPAVNVNPDDFTSFEADSANKRNELLFNITNQIEETKAKLKQAEQLVERLRITLREYEDMYKALTRGKGKEK
jgi:hypothetical protein